MCIRDSIDTPLLIFLIFSNMISVNVTVTTFVGGACDFCSIDAVLRFNASPQATQYAAPGEAGVPHRSHFSYSTSTFFTSFLSLFWILLCTTNPKSARLHTNMAKHLLGSR